MPKSTENAVTRINNKAKAFIDYTPAELRKGKDWIILYYCKNPFTEEMERHRLRAPKMSNARTMEQHAKKIVAELNSKLAEGWSPYVEKAGNGFKTFDDAVNTYINIINKELKDGVKREDTIRSYSSMLNLIRTYIKEKKLKIVFAPQFNKAFVVGYLDWIYYERENSPRTYNNHLLFLKTFAQFLIGRGYIKDDPTSGIKNKPKGEKIRVVYSDRIKEIIREKLPIYNKEYFTLCMATYYCMIRRTEITKLKVKDIDLGNDIINIPGGISKNRTTESVTLPYEYKLMLTEHIKDANLNDFVFSDEGFKPGTKNLAPKKISDVFARFRKQYELPPEIQWYGFKDTGITDLFESGALSSLNIRDQARHKELKTTELYTKKTKPGDLMVKNSGAKF